MQVDNNALEDVHAISMFSLDYSEDGQDEDEESLGDIDPYEWDEDDIKI